MNDSFGQNSVHGYVGGGRILSLTGIVLWRNMIRAPGFLSWPVMLGLTVIAAVLMAMSRSIVVLLYVGLVAAGLYYAVMRPLGLYVQLWRHLKAIYVPGDYWSEFNDDELVITGPRGRRSVRFRDVARVERFGRAVFIGFVEEGEKHLVIPAELIPGEELDRLNTWVIEHRRA